MKFITSHPTHHNQILLDHLSTHRVSVIGYSPHILISQPIIVVNRTPPLCDVLRMNFDGSLKSSGSSCISYICSSSDVSGQTFILGFGVKFLSFAPDILHVESFACFEGIIRSIPVMIKCGYQMLEVEGDNINVIQHLSGVTHPPPSLEGLYSVVRVLLLEVQEYGVSVSIKHVHREANVLANYICKHASIASRFEIDEFKTMMFSILEWIEQYPLVCRIAKLSEADIVKSYKDPMVPKQIGGEVLLSEYVMSLLTVGRIPRTRIDSSQMVLWTSGIGILVGDKLESSIAESDYEGGEIGLILHSTNFYSPSLGSSFEVMNEGFIRSPLGTFEVLYVEFTGDYVVHFGFMIDGLLNCQDLVSCAVDVKRRSNLDLNRTFVEDFVSVLKSLFDEHVVVHRVVNVQDQFIIDLKFGAPFLSSQSLALKQALPKHLPGLVILAEGCLEITGVQRFVCSIPDVNVKVNIEPLWKSI